MCERGTAEHDTEQTCAASRVVRCRIAACSCIRATALLPDGPGERMAETNVLAAILADPD